MKNKNIFFVVILLLVSSLLSAQHWCGFTHLDQLKDTTDHHTLEKNLKEYLKSKPLKRGGDEEIYQIPVVVHILHNNDTDEVGVGDNISDEQVASAIKVLNDHFRRDHEDTTDTPSRFIDLAADIGIEFCLASQDPEGNPSNGITRNRTPQRIWSFNESDEVELKSYSYWSREEYLNIWVTRIRSNILGYAYFPEGTNLDGLPPRNRPELDGVVISPIAFGNNIGTATGSNNLYKFGRTLIHEVAHWLGLRHIFADDETCSYTDYCADTPKQRVPNTILSNCSETIVGDCGEVVMHQNYMDYTKDVCVNLFTKDQKTRMRDVMETSPSRKALRFSKGCCGSGLSIGIPSLIDFEEEEELLNNWELNSSNEELFSWEISNGELVAPANDSLTRDSIVLVSGGINYEVGKQYFLRFNATSDGVDSIKIYYERSCSGVLEFLSKIDLTSEAEDFRIPLIKLNSDGLVKVYIVAYNNGNETRIDDLQFYEEQSDLTTSIHPNPSLGKLKISYLMEGDREVKVEVFNLQGKLMQSIELGKVNSGVSEVDLSSLVKGYYILRIIADDLMNSEKLILH